MLANETWTIGDVQAVLLAMLDSKTMLIVHSLNSDMKALKLIYGCIVDTLILYPHEMGTIYETSFENTF
uniref:Uncharacterized protein n=1 Tax=Megaselia scalaris TaxID=36166 RepID=T1GAC7_MEGSC